LAKVGFSEQHVVRSQGGLIVIAYKTEASQGCPNSYTAQCATTMRRLDHDESRVVQHQQLPPPTANDLTRGFSPRAIS